METDDGWTHFEIERKQPSRNFLHIQEEIDGVLYVTMTEFDSEGKMMRKVLTRADLVRG